MVKEFELDWEQIGERRRAVLSGNDNYRVVVENMDHAEAPDWDGMAYILSDGGRYGYYSFEGTTPEDSNIAHAFETFELKDFERYLRIFHGMRDFRTVYASYHQGGPTYYVFDTAALREEWGVEPDYANGAEGTAAEWKAYIDGEVYGIYCERAVEVESYKTVVATGERVPAGTEVEWEEYGDDAVWSLYGWQAVEDLNISESVADGELSIG